MEVWRRRDHVRKVTEGKVPRKKACLKYAWRSILHSCTRSQMITVLLSFLHRLPKAKCSFRLLVMRIKECNISFIAGFYGKPFFLDIHRFLRHFRLLSIPRTRLEYCQSLGIRIDQSEPRIFGQRTNQMLE